MSNNRREYGFIMSDSRFRSLSNSSNSFGYKELCFALADLADDGSVELVIGVKSDGEYIICTIIPMTVIQFIAPIRE